VDLLDHLRQERWDKAAACRKGVLGTQRRDAAAVLLAGLSASMSIPWCDSRSERLFDVTESVLGIGISGESPPNRTFHPWRSKCPYRRPTFQNPVNEHIGLDME
jgi:hypothetical protein